MKTTCPKFVSTHWLSMKRILEWLTKHHAHIISYIDDKSHACKPTLDWWIVIVCLHSVATILFVSCLQRPNTLFGQHVVQFKKLNATLVDIYKVNMPIFDDNFVSLDLDVPRVLRGPYTMTFVDAKDFGKNQGMFVIYLFANLTPNRFTAILHSIANFSDGMYCGIVNVITNRDSNNLKLKSIVATCFSTLLCIGLHFLGE